MHLLRFIVLQDRHLKECMTRIRFKMAQYILSTILCAAVQTFLPAGWTKSRKRCCLSAWRSAYAFGCVCTDLDGRTGGIKHREEIAACNIGKINMETIFLRLATAVCVLRKRGTAQTLTKQKRSDGGNWGGGQLFWHCYVYAGNEVAVGEILHRNHCREKINLATKLPHYLIKSIDGVEKMFQEELRRLADPITLIITSCICWRTFQPGRNWKNWGWKSGSGRRKRPGRFGRSDFPITVIPRCSVS